MSAPVRTLAVLSVTAAAAALLTATPGTAAEPTIDRPGHDLHGIELHGHDLHDLDLHWEITETGSDQQFRGLDAVNRRIAWVGGSDGQVLRTTDGGDTWEDVSPDDTAGLLFRDVEAHSAMHASVMAIGLGEASRIYTTRDGGTTWTLAFFNDDPDAFYDCMAFWDHRRGIGMSDPVDGKFRIIRTSDGGLTWRVLSDEGMPEARPGEAGFAASGTCIATAGVRDAWFGAGGTPVGTAARIFHSDDAGHTWSVTDTPIPASPAGGVFSLDFRDTRHGIAVGGDFLAPENGVDASAFTRDGDTWIGGGDLSGYRSGVSWFSQWLPIAIAVGPTGSDITFDGGRRWIAFDETNLDAVDCTRDLACWASGPEGAVAVLDL
jgi:photosystem II stability/assembly factor-like uncharacterized protein